MEGRMGHSLPVLSRMDNYPGWIILEGNQLWRGAQVGLRSTVAYEFDLGTY